jgi:Flp pilus assembly protein TadD
LRAARGEADQVSGQLLPYLTKQPGQTPPVLEALGTGFLSKQDYGNAQWCAEGWRLAEPENPSAYLLEGRVHLQAGNYRGAKGPLEKGLELAPDNAELRASLARVLLFLERLERAAAYRERRDYEKASRVLQELLAECPDNAATLHERGLLEMDQGEHAKAVETFRKVLTIDPLRPLTHQKLSECLRRLGKEAEADQHAVRARELNEVARRLEALKVERARSPEKPALHHQIGEVLFKQGKVGEAMNSFRTALDLDPYFRPTHKLLADYYKIIGKDAEESRHRRRAGP